jgi:hypothetical protein
MEWFTRFIEYGFRKEADRQWEETQATLTEQALNRAAEPKVIDMMADDTDPEEVTIENAYKTRWIWYHTILAIGIFFTNVLLISILVLLAIKL